jgi:sodium/pantothenate symporter
MAAGIATYLYFNYFIPRPLGLHPIVPSLVLSLAAFVVVARMTKKPSAEVIKLFWGL